MDCTGNCKFKKHGDYLTSIVTSASIEEIKKVIKEKCANPFKVIDKSGRTILHVAASCGNLEVLEYFCEESASKSILQIRDKESGWTALHRALYYGHIDCAVFLYEVVKEWRPFDNEGISPLDLTVLASPRLHKKRRKKLKLGVVVLPFEAETPSELTLHSGDVIEIFDHLTGLLGWSYGRNQSTGATGSYPKHFVEEMKIDEEKQDVWYQPKNTLHMWGNNINFTLGLGDSKQRQFAELNDTMFQTNQSVIDVVITKFHTVILTDDGKIFTCGHGHGGRLGHGNEETVLYLKQIEKLSFYHCVSIAASNQHTVVLTELGEVLTFGLNEFYQLGQSPPVKFSTKPTPVYNKNLRGRKLVGIACSRFHTVMHTDKEVFTFGTNGGQMGFAKNDEVISTPKLISRLMRTQGNVVQVAASDGATLCLFSDGELYILEEYICRKIKDIGTVAKHVAIRVTGGTLQLKKPDMDRAEPLKIAVLQSSGVVYLWCTGYKSFKECNWQGCKLPAYSKIVDIALGKHLILTTDSGQVYFGHFSTKVRKRDSTEIKQHLPGKAMPSKVEVLDGSFSLDDLHQRVRQKKLEYEDVQLEHVPLIYRCIKCSCDPKTRTFASIQYDPRIEMKRRPSVSPSNLQEDLKTLISDTSNHDLVLKTKRKTFLVHKFILQCRLGEKTYNHIFDGENNEVRDGKTTINFENINEDDLDNWLRKVYTGNCDVVQDLVSAHCQKITENSEENDNAFAHQMASFSNLDLEDPCDDSTVFFEDNNLNSISPSRRNKKKPKSAFAMYKERSEPSSKDMESKKRSKRKEAIHQIFTLESWRKYSSVSDITIESEDNQMFYCHKCILTSRSEYFRNMLSYGWIEASSSSLCETVKIPIPGDILGVLLDFLYTGTIDTLKDHEDITFIGEVLVCADQLVISRLKELCELYLADKVNLKNVVDLFQFSCLYKAEQLISFTCNFLVLNLPYFLEARLLENVSYEDLKILSEEYRNVVQGMDERRIKPSNLYQQIDERKQELQNAFRSDLNKMKAHRKRSSNSIGEAKEQVESNKMKNNALEVSLDDDAFQEEIKSTGPLPLQEQKKKTPNCPWGITANTDLGVDVTGKTINSLEIKKRHPESSPFKKKSQRERRREASQSQSEKEETHQKELSNESVCPWGNSSSNPVKSFKDVLSEEVDPSNNQMKSAKKTNRNTASKFKKKINLEELGKPQPKTNAATSQRNAWSAPTIPPEKNQASLSQSSFHETKEDFTNIVQVQAEEKQQQIKDSKKPLTTIQLEERAMEELKIFYEKQAKNGETITVKRLKRIENVIPFWDRVLH